MAATYSIGNTGCAAGNAQQPLVFTVSDAVCNSVGAEQQAMRLGTQFLCKNPDGSQSYYTYDVERSIPGVKRVLRAVGP